MNRFDIIAAMDSPDVLIVRKMKRKMNANAIEYRPVNNGIRVDLGEEFKEILTPFKYLTPYIPITMNDERKNRPHPQIH